MASGGRDRTLPTRDMVAAITRLAGTSSPPITTDRQAARQLRLDLAALEVYAAVDRGEPWAVRLVITTLGRDRDYVE